MRLRRHHLPVSAPTRVALLSLGVVEVSLGGCALVALGFLGLDVISGSLPLAWGVLTPLTLLVLAGLGIFVRRPWTYLLHCLVTPVALVGAAVALTFELGPTRGTPVVALTVVATGILQLFFLTSEVHRWFEDIGQE